MKILKTLTAMIFMITGLISNAQKHKINTWDAENNLGNTIDYLTRRNVDYKQIIEEKKDSINFKYNELIKDFNSWKAWRGPEGNVTAYQSDIAEFKTTTRAHLRDQTDESRFIKDSVSLTLYLQNEALQNIVKIENNKKDLEYKAMLKRYADKSKMPKEHRLLLPNGFKLCKELLTLSGGKLNPYPYQVKNKAAYNTKLKQIKLLWKRFDINRTDCGYETEADVEAGNMYTAILNCASLRYL